MNKTQKIHRYVCPNFKKKGDVASEEISEHEDSDQEIMVVNRTLKSLIFTGSGIDKTNSNNCGNVKGRKTSVNSKNNKIENKRDSCNNQSINNIFKKILPNNTRKSNVDSGIAKQPILEKKKTEIKITNVPTVQKSSKKQITVNDKISVKNKDEIKKSQLGKRKEILGSYNNKYSDVKELKEKTVEEKLNEEPNEESYNVNDSIRSSSSSSTSNISEEPNVNLNYINKEKNTTYEQTEYNQNMPKLEDHTGLCEKHTNTFKIEEEYSFRRYDSTSVIKYDDFELNEINEELNKIIEEERIIQEQILRLTDRELELLMQRNKKRNQKKIRERQKQKEQEKERQQENQQQYDVEII